LLTYLSIKNLAVIESTNLDFGQGLNIITGETGAGKSVLVGALKFLMGERFNRSVLRDTNKELSVEAIFQHLPDFNDELKEAFNIEDEVSLSRIADSDAKNKVLINNKVAPVNKLKEISEYLMDIHGQHEHQLLFNASKHLDLIDYFIPDNIKNEYLKAYTKYKNKCNELVMLEKEIDESKRLRDIYILDIKEIADLDIDVEKDSQIEQEIIFLSEIDKVKQSTASALELLDAGEISATDLILKSIKILSTVKHLSSDLSKSTDEISKAYDQIKDSVQLLENIFDKQSVGENELNALIDRKYKLSNLYKKYITTDISEILNKYEELKNRLEAIESSDDLLNNLRLAADTYEKEARIKAEILNYSRYDISKDLSLKVVDILDQLELLGSSFEVRFKTLEKLDKRGGIAAEFFISTNKGFDLAPLANIASGGEVSRVMLALKEVFAESDNVETLLFDEIDTGISGKAAKSVAMKLKSLSKKKQLIVITHLPVVAAMADHHFHISKDQGGELSTTNILKLDDKMREKILAVMITGQESELAISQARELISKGINN